MLWDLLANHGEPYLHAIVTAAALHPALRAPRPWISHGTLHLLHPDDPDDPVGSARRSLAFLPADEEAWFQVFVYTDAIGPVEDAATAAATAAAAAATW